MKPVSRYIYSKVEKEFERSYKTGICGEVTQNCYSRDNHLEKKSKSRWQSSEPTHLYTWCEPVMALEEINVAIDCGLEEIFFITDNLWGTLILETHTIPFEEFQLSFVKIIFRTHPLVIALTLLVNT